MKLLNFIPLNQKFIPRLFRNLKICFIPDGNRRFIKKVNRGKQCTSEEINIFGRVSGTNKFSEIVEWLYKDELNEIDSLGRSQETRKTDSSREMSIYGYSLQNYLKRSKQETDNIFDIFREFTNEKNKKYEKIMKLFKIEFIGNIHHLDDERYGILMNIMEKTKNNKFRCFILFFYSGIMELDSKTASESSQIPEESQMSTEAENIKDSNPVLINKIRTTEIDSTKKNIPDSRISVPHILIRTGYQKRLSDFMLNHCAKGVNINFIDCYWPELTRWHILLCIIKYYIERML